MDRSTLAWMIGEGLATGLGGLALLVNIPEGFAAATPLAADDRALAVLVTSAETSGSPPSRSSGASG